MVETWYLIVVCLIWIIVTGLDFLICVNVFNKYMFNLSGWIKVELLLRLDYESGDRFGVVSLWLNLIEKGLVKKKS